MERMLPSHLAHTRRREQCRVNGKSDRWTGQPVTGHPFHVVVEDLSVWRVATIDSAVANNVQTGGFLVPNNRPNSVLVRLPADRVIDELTLGVDGIGLPVIPARIGIIAHHSCG